MFLEHILRRVFLGVCISVAIGCGAFCPPQEVESVGAALRDSQSMPAFAAIQEITIKHAEGAHAFRAVLESNKGIFRLVAMGPHGGRAFTITQRGKRVEFEKHVPFEMPFSPIRMLEDVHRVWFLGRRGLASNDGEHLHSVEGHSVRDIWLKDRLIRRIFPVQTEKDSGKIEIEYVDGLAANGMLREKPSSAARLTHGVYGYEIQIETTAFQPVDL